MNRQVNERERDAVLKVWSLAVAFVIQAASSELNMFNFLFSTPSPALLQDVCLLAAHITEPYKRQLKRMCNTNSAWGEREKREKEKRNWRGGEWERQKERKRGSMWGKMYSTTSPSKPGLILCLLIFITIAASCKMFDGFVQILVPLIHNYCYTCRTKGNFRRGAVWKAAARL